MRKGYWSLVVHAHLPYVPPTKNDVSFQEQWFFECLSEVYLPLLEKWEVFAEQYGHVPITLSVSPTLLAMCADPILQERYAEYLQTHSDLSSTQIESEELADFYTHRYRALYASHVVTHSSDMIARWKRLAVKYGLELITTAATHAYLPMWQHDLDLVKAQIQSGLDAFETYFSWRPKGFWLPECGFVPGFDAICKSVGIDYTFVETHGVLHARPLASLGTFAPLQTPSGLQVWGRDTWTSAQVWSQSEGFPGGYLYREYHQHEDCARALKCEAISTNGVQRDYDPHLAQKMAQWHAHYFYQGLKDHLGEASQYMPTDAIAVSCYDAELFGQWWYEGPEWMDAVMRLCQEQAEIEMLTGADMQMKKWPLQCAIPEESSWGYGGYHEVWIDESHDWIYEAIKTRWTKMQNWQGSSEHYDRLREELFLAQSSDWPFMIRSGQSKEYAEQRVRGHLEVWDQIYAL